MALLPMLSYAQKHKIKDQGKNSVMMTFNIDDNIKTNSGDSFRYVLEIYDATDQANLKFLRHLEQTTTEFDIQLMPGNAYTCLFWADKGIVNDNTSSSFNAESLMNVQLNDGKAMEEAFFRSVNFVMVETSDSKTLTLKRAVAKVELIEETQNTIGSTIEIKFNGYKGFNTLNGSVTGSQVSITENVITIATTGLIGSFLTLAPVGTDSSGGVVVDLELTPNLGTTIWIQDTRLTANFKTKVHGTFK